MGKPAGAKLEVQPRPVGPALLPSPTCLRRLSVLFADVSASQSLPAGCQASMIGRASGAFLSPPTRHRCCSPGSLPPLHSSSAYTMFPLGFHNLPPIVRLKREKRVPAQLQPQNWEERQVKHSARGEECGLGNSRASTVAVIITTLGQKFCIPLAEFSLQVSPQATAATLAF